MEDTWPYIFSLIKYNKNISLVCKYWDRLYKKAISLYPIKISLKADNLSKFLEISNISGICSLEILECHSKDLSYNTKIPYINTLEELSIFRSTENIILPDCVRLKKLAIMYCKSIANIPSSNLECLYIRNCGGDTGVLPGFKTLKILCIEKYDCLKEIPLSTANTLQKLMIKYCGQIIRLPNFINLTYLLLTKCPIIEIPISITNILERLTINSCPYISIIPNCKKLKELTISDNNKIREIPYSIAKTLRYLNIDNCKNITILPNFTRLMHLYLRKSSIKEIPVSIKKLIRLYVKDCSQINNLPNFIYLHDLNIINCSGIKNIPESIIDSLRYLYIYNCKHTTTLPNFTRPKKSTVKGCGVTTNTSQYMNQLHVFFTKLKHNSQTLNSK